MLQEVLWMVEVPGAHWLVAHYRRLLYVHTCVSADYFLCLHCPCVVTTTSLVMASWTLCLDLHLQMTPEEPV